MTTTNIIKLDISDHFIRSVRQELEDKHYLGKQYLETYITIKGEYLRDDWHDGDTEYDADDVAEYEGQLFSYDPNHQANLSLSEDVVQKYKDELQDLIDDDTIVWWEDHIRQHCWRGNPEEAITKAKEDGRYVGCEWQVTLNQLNPITNGKENGYTISDEGLLRFNGIPEVVWEHLEGSWCDG